MLQKITSFNTYSETVFDLTCPKCGKKNEIGLLRFLDANNNHKSITCVDCKKEFYVEVLCLTRDVELRNEAVDVGQTCPYCNDTKVLLNGDEERICWHCYDFSGQV